MEHKPNLVKYECGRSAKSKKKSITDDKFIKKVERSLKAVFLTITFLTMFHLTGG